MNTRQHALEKWLINHCRYNHIEGLPGDASFRRYFRIYHPEGSFIAMDAPPSTENCVPFIAIANALRHHGLQTPTIIASDLTQGFLLLTDFGDDLFLKKLNENNAEKFYNQALDALALLQSCPPIVDWKVPLFTAEFMRQELELFKEWFLRRYLHLSLSPPIEKELNHCFDFLAAKSAKQKQVFMHRDFHSANLMLLPQRQVGILDFQDAFIGPVTYDLVSLLRDCYIAWPDTLVTQLALSYREKINLLSVSEEEFLTGFDVMGMQRHLKALLTFSRKFCRDQNAHYLQHIPRTVNYLLTVSARYSSCTILNNFLQEHVACVE